MSVADFWEGHYAQRAQVWSGRPNPLLVAEVADLPAGTALDLGCGEGADAIWLAERGWHVTAVDVAQTALDRGARQAGAEGVDHLVVWQRLDLGAAFPSGSFDLVSAQYLQSPVDLPRDDILRAAAAVVAPGGTLLIVAHAGAPSWADHAGPPGGFPDPSDTARAIGLHESGWDLVTCGVRERAIVAPTGEPATIADSVVKARRRSQGAAEDSSGYGR